MNKNGFTLIELLITVALIGILSGVLLQALKPEKIKNRAQDAVRKEDLSVIAGAFERYYADNNSYPATMPTAGSPFAYGGITYLQNTPVGPDGDTYTCLQSDGAYGVSCIGGQSFKICATLEVPGSETNPFCIKNAF